ncbi:MAG: alpha/beta hydrolase [Gemmatimonadota bacterium]
MRIPVAHGHLEALMKEPDGAPHGVAVVCHPHPLHGGTMHTKAVYRAAQALNEAGLVALRFNFRGVGASTGSYEEGIGEREDVTAAIDWLVEEYPHLPVICGGFSFGSMVGLAVGVDDDRVDGLLGLGLPVKRLAYDFGYLGETTKLLLVVQGEQDEFGSGEEVAAALAGMESHVTLVRIPGSDHYFTDRLDELREAVRGYFQSGPGAKLLVRI